MRYGIVLVFGMVYLMFGREMGYCKSSSLWTHFVYMFQHANLLHLFINGFTLVYLLDVLRVSFNYWLLLGYGYVCAVVGSFFSVSDLPTVGASGFIYGLLGLYVVSPLFGFKFTIVDKRKYLNWIVITLVCSVVTSFFKGVNGLNHLFSFGFGCVLGVVDNLVHGKLHRNNKGE